MSKKKETNKISRKVFQSIGMLFSFLLDVPYVEGFLNLLKTVIIAGGAALLVRTLIAEPFHIPSGSMIPTFHIGDHVFVSKYPYGYSKYSILFAPNIFSGRVLKRQPERGDIIVFRAPGHKDDYIKRLIGLPGDRVQVKKGKLYLNGKAVKREEKNNFHLTQVERAWEKQAMTVGQKNQVIYTKGRSLFVDGKEENFEDFTLNYVSRCQLPPQECQVYQMKKYVETLPNGVSYEILDLRPDGELDNTKEFVVPEGHYFGMGDNRDMSSDSRVFGFIPEENLIGRAEFIFFSTNHYLPMLGLILPWEWIKQLRFERFFNGV